MKQLIIILALSIAAAGRAGAQNKVYTENSGEIIFSFADVEYLGERVPTNMRFTAFLHLGQNFHYDFTDNIGMYSRLWAEKHRDHHRF